MIYSQELKDRTFKAYEEDVSNGVVRQRELEEKVLMYYRRTTPSLQEYYSDLKSTRLNSSHPK